MDTPCLLGMADVICTVSVIKVKVTTVIVCVFCNSYAIESMQCMLSIMKYSPRAWVIRT